MKHQSSERQDQSSENSDLAQLQIIVDRSGFVEYNCDWDDSAEGIVGIASIFYKVFYENLTYKILEGIKDQCVLNNNEDDYNNIVKVIAQFAQDDEEGVNDDEVVIPPDQIFNL